MAKDTQVAQKNILEHIANSIQYDDLGIWKKEDIISFSKKKKLFDYQIDAIQNITKILHVYFQQSNGKETLKELYKQHGYEASEEECKNLNRICLWMATGSGKSLVIIKTIELLDYLQSLTLIPKKEILFLPPREELLTQFRKEVEEYNYNKRDKNIELLPLVEYENEDISILPQGYNIKVYYCLSHLLKEEHKENQLDYRSYLNYGNWYVMLDEAHRGESKESLLKKYVNKLSENGFLFNFSATFVDEIDRVSTGFNFNLERFIKAGFGKNIYLSESYFDFQATKDEFIEKQKQKQVVKSLLVFTLIKQSRKNFAYYHNPLMLTLVNSVNKNTKSIDSDLVMFFKKLQEIANGDIKKELFQEAKDELHKEFGMKKKYLFNDEYLKGETTLLQNITDKNILESIFNAKNFSDLEYIAGETGKEIVLKMQNSDTPFALIRIGDTQQFIKHYLLGNYVELKDYQIKNYFQNLNDSEINILMGSRTFYEGWDSNRPNVINFINIGKKEAKKFVPQAIGRGIRIEPTLNKRKRLLERDKEKNKLLETLFIFPTDKGSFEGIINSIENEKENKKSTNIELQKTEQLFELLIPFYKEAEQSGDRFAKFNISKNSLRNFNSYYDAISKEALLLNTFLGVESLNLFEEKRKNDFFQTKDGLQTDYQDMSYLLQRIIRHVSLRNPVVESIKKIEDEIIHFKHIAVSQMSDIEIEQLKNDINFVNSYENDPLDEDTKKALAIIKKKQNISFTIATQNKQFKDLYIEKIAQHYYTPIIYSEQEKIEYINHVIKVASEVSFVKNLIHHIQDKNFNFQWMFSKIDESLDKQVYIPYFYKTDNWYRNFYPDFIFWIRKDNHYKIVYIDPKGTKYADYLDKLDGFESMFTENNIPKTFFHKKYTITFELKMITDDMNKVSGDRYQHYWLPKNDFSFLCMEKENN